MLLFSNCFFKKLCYNIGVYILSRNLLNMTDSQTHLKSAIEQRDAIVQEIQELNTDLVAMYQSASRIAVDVVNYIKTSYNTAFN